MMPLRVDIATGATTLHEVDLRLPGFIPFELARTYRSSSREKGPFGCGWAFSLDTSLYVENHHLTYRQASGKELFFKPIDVGMQVTHPEAGVTVEHHPDAYIVFASPLLRQVFMKRPVMGPRHYIDRIEDRSGHALEFFRQGKKLVGILDTMGRQVRLTYNGDRLVAIAVLGRPYQEAARVLVRSFHYDGYGHLIAAIDPSGSRVQYTYSNHLMVACTNRLGGVQYATYGPDQRCLGLWRTDGSLARRPAYDDLRRTVRVMHADGHQVVYRTYDDQVLARIDPLGGRQDYYYDEQRCLLGFSDAQGTVVAFQRRDPEAGTCVHLRGEQTAVFEFDDRGLASTVSDGLCAYALAYDEQGNPVALTTPTGAVWAFVRDDQGRVIHMHSPEGHCVALTYSDDGLVRRVHDDLGLHREERYDLFGRLVERADALGRHEHRAYDQTGRLTAVKVDGGYEVRFAYDAAGNLTSTTDSRYRDFRMQYDAFGRLMAYTGPDGHRHQFHYDREDHLVSVQAQGKTTRFTYDAQGRLVQDTDAEGRVRTYCYDAQGIVVMHHEAAGLTQVHTALMALTEETLADGTAHRFTYAPSGALVAATLEEGESTFEYDDEGHLAMVLKGDAALSFAYNRDGNLRSVEDEAGRCVVMQYDGRGRVVEAHVGAHVACRFSYDAGDRLATLQVSEGPHYTFTYDGLDRLQARNREEEGQPPDYHPFHTTEAKPLRDRLACSSQRFAEGAREPASTQEAVPEKQATVAYAQEARPTEEGQAADKKTIPDVEVPDAYLVELRMWLAQGGLAGALSDEKIEAYLTEVQARLREIGLDEDDQSLTSAPPQEEQAETEEAATQAEREAPEGEGIEPELDLAELQAWLGQLGLEEMVSDEKVEAYLAETQARLQELGLDVDAKGAFPEVDVGADKDSGPSEEEPPEEGGAEPEPDLAALQAWLGQLGLSNMVSDEKLEAYLAETQARLQELGLDADAEGLDLEDDASEDDGAPEEETAVQENLATEDSEAPGETLDEGGAESQASMKPPGTTGSSALQEPPDAPAAAPSRDEATASKTPITPSVPGMRGANVHLVPGMRAAASKGASALAKAASQEGAEVAAAAPGAGVGSEAQQDSKEGAGAVEAILYQSRLGLVLAVRLGEMEIPIWLQDHYLIKADTNLTRCIVDAVLQGVEAGLCGRSLPSGPDILRRWTTQANRRTRTGGTEIPQSHEVGPAWRMLDQFFLDRSVYDEAWPHQMPGYAAHHQADPARAPDPVLTGMHMTGDLQPPDWGLSAFRKGDTRPVILAQGSLHPEDVEHLLEDS